MQAYDLIKKKRDGGELSPEEIRFLVDAFTRGEVPDYSMSAFLMAAFIRGLAGNELSALASAMLASGVTVDLSDVPLPKIDKHSTGGVGDKVSLCLAPLAAACGVAVPMVSGRSLGHTGGTLDKLEAVPGFNVNLSLGDFRRTVREIGLCMIGQTREIAPADKKIYALRDATATVESIPLIASSIMSKKLAEGIDGLVLDVKVGSGAFMKKAEDARLLARTMIGIGRSMGKKVRALLTDMSQPLGTAVGNSNEAIETFEVLKGKGPADLVELTVELGAEMLTLGGVAAGLEEGRAKIRDAIRSGAGLERMKACVKAQGGNPAALDDYGLMPVSKKTRELCADSPGYVFSIDTEAVGRASMLLGAGRDRVGAAVDPSVGIMVRAKRGCRVAKGDPLAAVMYNSEDRIEEACEMVRRAYRISGRRPAQVKLILERL